MLEMPMGTVYSLYEPCIFRELLIKADQPKNYENDWLYDSLIGAIEPSDAYDTFTLCEEMEKGNSVPMDFEYTGRDGMFDDKQLYAIYEKEDVEKLIKRLELATLQNL